MRKLTENLMDELLIVVAALIVLVLLPGVIVGVAGSDAGLLISLLLLFAVDPMFFALAGMHAGKKAEDGQQLLGFIRPLILSGGAFLFGVSLVLEMSMDFALKYMAVYLVIGFAAMGLTAWNKWRK